MYLSRPSCTSPFSAPDLQVLPDTKVAQTMGSAMASVLSLFAGFLISPAKVPDFWLFAYYLNPLHYIVEVRLL